MELVLRASFDLKKCECPLYPNHVKSFGNFLKSGNMRMSICFEAVIFYHPPDILVSPICTNES